MRLLGWMVSGWTATFPRMYAYCKEHGVDTAGMMALVEAETGFRGAAGTPEGD